MYVLLSPCGTPFGPFPAHDALPVFARAYKLASLPRVRASCLRARVEGLLAEFASRILSSRTRMKLAGKSCLAYPIFARMRQNLGGQIWLAYPIFARARQFSRARGIERLCTCESRAKRRFFLARVEKNGYVRTRVGLDGQFSRARREVRLHEAIMGRFGRFSRARGIERLCICESGAKRSIFSRAWKRTCVRGNHGAFCGIFSRAGNSSAHTRTRHKEAAILVEDAPFCPIFSRAGKSSARTCARHKVGRENWTKRHFLARGEK